MFRIAASLFALTLVAGCSRGRLREPFIPLDAGEPSRAGAGVDASRSEDAERDAGAPCDCPDAGEPPEASSPTPDASSSSPDASSPPPDASSPPPDASSPPPDASSPPCAGSECTSTTPLCSGQLGLPGPPSPPATRVEGTPVGFAFTDLNADGMPDLAVADRDGQNVAVWLAVGAGAFGPIARYSTGAGAEPTALTVADVDGELGPDLVVGRRAEPGLSLLLNRGDGSFDPGIELAPDTATGGATVADLDADGAVDLLYSDSGLLRLLRNLGGAAFALDPAFAVGMHPGAIAVADLDGDGLLDLVMGNGYTPAVTVARNLGGLAFTEGVDYPVDRPPSTISAADLNGDDRPELILTVGTSEDGELRVMQNRGDGTFALALLYPTGALYGHAIVDLDADGDLDLAFSHGDYAIRVLQNRGDGAFSREIDYPVGGASELAPADFDADGKPDLALLCYPWRVELLRNLGDGSFHAPVRVDAGYYPQALAAADFDGDGMLDLAIPTDTRSAQPMLLRGHGDGTFDPASADDWGIAHGAAEAADLDGDGDADLAAASFQPGSVDVFLNHGQGDGLFGPRASYPIPAGASSLNIADLDTDGLLDIAIATGGDELAVLWNVGHGGFATERTFPTGSASSAVVTGDFDGDGLLDLAATHWPSHDVGVLRNLSQRRFAPATFYPASMGPGALAAGDFDSDGDLDLAVGGQGSLERPISGELSILNNDGSGAFTTTLPAITLPVAPGAMAAVDLDGDSRLDLALSLREDSSVGVLLNRGGLGFAELLRYPAGPSPRDLVVADFDRDQRPDLAVGATNQEGVSVLLNRCLP